MSYVLMGLGGVAAPPLRQQMPAQTPAVAPSWPWQSITCPADGMSLRNEVQQDGTVGYYCNKAVFTVPGQPVAPELPPPPVAQQLAGSLVVTKAKEKRERDEVAS